MSECVNHCFEPVFDRNSRVLVLGTMPSPASRENGFYYSHPRNRFWPVLARIFDEQPPAAPEEKRAFALRHKIALWDVLASCEIEKAADSSIKKPLPNKLSLVFEGCDISAVFTTGAAATRLYDRFFPDAGYARFSLPSTSPANCRCPVERLLNEYSLIARYTGYAISAS